MSELVADCPRCQSNSMTFDVTAQVFTHTQYDWQSWYEVFAVCRNCLRPTIFGLKQKTSADGKVFEKPDALVNYGAALNHGFVVAGFVNLRHHSNYKPPEHLTEDIKTAFEEAATCLSITCYNAAATMFRLCVDIATRPLLPEASDDTVTQPNRKQRRDLGLRLPWLFENNRLPVELRELAHCIKEDANDGAHVGNLSKADAEDLMDFTTALLERLFTEPRKLELAAERRAKRRDK